jgi:hypothetical protein
MTLVDCRFDALRTQGYLGTTSDMLMFWLADNGGVGGAMNDLWHTMLLSKGFTGATTDMWYQYLFNLGYRGHINDMEMAFWCSGGVFPIGPDFNQLDFLAGDFA